MKKITLLAAFLAVTTLMNAQTEDITVFNFATDADTQGWTSLNSASITTTGGALSLETNNASFSKAELTEANYDGDEFIVLKAFTDVEVTINSTGGHDKISFQWDYITALVPGGGTKNVSKTGLADEVQTLTFRLDNKDEWTTATSISSIRISPVDTATPTAEGKSNGGTLVIDKIEFVGATLSNSMVSDIPGATVSVANGNIMVNGANLVAVYNITGQQVSAKGLTSGIYIVKISKNGSVASVKVAM